MDETEKKSERLVLENCVHFSRDTKEKWKVDRNCWHIFEEEKRDEHRLKLMALRMIF
jgi:hypothetical protein